MNIILLHASRGLTPDLVQQSLDQLGATDLDDVRLVSWLYPRSPCTVSRHSVVGPSILSNPRAIAVRPIDGEPAAQSVPAATHARTLGSAKVAASGGTDHRATLVRKLTTSVTHPLASARMAPHRLRSASKKVRASTRVQKAAARAIPGGVRSEFGAFPQLHRGFKEWFADADLVVCLDDASSLAAWNVARLYPRPRVHSSVAGAAYVAEELRGRASAAKRAATSS